MWNPESALKKVWNPESRNLESGIQRLGIRNPALGIRNPPYDWIPLHGAKNKEGIIYLCYKLYNMGRQTTKYSLSSHYKNYMRIMQFIVIDRHRILNLNYLTT